MTRREAFPKLPSAIRAPSTTFVVPAALDMDQGREAVSRALKRGPLRPFDMESQTTIEQIAPLWVPFWRVRVSVDALHVNVSNVDVGSTHRAVPIPTGAGRYRDTAIMICARTAIAYEPKLPFSVGRMTVLPPLEIGADELVRDPSPEMLHANDAEVVDADVDRERAESIAMGMVIHALGPTHAVFPTYETRIRDSDYCFYPLYYANYTYSGEARRYPGERLFVAVSGTTGAVVAASYPSASRSVAAKLRRILSFDRRGA
ncbi:MAG TPA: hypothetical protein VM580_32710 [Labilithrix sp.]|nr:hypothetical protein [Labilithrix sp.]